MKSNVNSIVIEREDDAYGDTKLEQNLERYWFNTINNKYIFYDTVYLVLLSLLSEILSYMPHVESLLYHVNLSDTSLFRLAH